MFAAVFLFFGLKGCVVTVWRPTTDTTTYAIHGADGRSLTMIFMPNHETYIVYTKEEPYHTETLLTKMRGTYGTHYFWRLWSIEGPGATEGLFSYRVYPKDTEPVVMEITVLNKFIQGNGDPAFPKKGDRTHPILLFSSSAVRIEDMWLQKEPTDFALVDVLGKMLKSDR